MSDFVLKVSTEEIKNKANEITAQVDEIKKNWQLLSDVVKNSKDYWKGEASQLHRQYRKDIADDIKEILKRLREHPTDLLKVAGIYEEAESNAMQLAQSLPEDIIV